MNANEIKKIMFGGSEISKVMFGDVVVWSSSKYEWAEDTDFEFVTSTAISAYLYNGKKGYFKYIGTKEYVAIPDTIKGVQMTSYYSLFRESPASVKGVYSDNSNVTDMSSMFAYSKATTLDLSNFDTSNVTNMSDMFLGSIVTTLDLSSFDTSSVTNMSRMFYNSKATTLDLSSFDTSNVTDMSTMFRYSRATTGYVRTQADADKFNASSGKPTGLNFVVKP